MLGTKISDVEWRLVVTLRYFNEFGNLRSNSEPLARALNLLIKSQLL